MADSWSETRSKIATIDVRTVVMATIVPTAIRATKRAYSARAAPCSSLISSLIRFIAFSLHVAVRPCTGEKQRSCHAKCCSLKEPDLRAHLALRRKPPQCSKDGPCICEIPKDFDSNFSDRERGLDLPARTVSPTHRKHFKSKGLERVDESEATPIRHHTTGAPQLGNSRNDTANVSDRERSGHRAGCYATCFEGVLIRESRSAVLACDSPESTVGLGGRKSCQLICFVFRFPASVDQPSDGGRESVSQDRVGGNLSITFADDKIEIVWRELRCHGQRHGSSNCNRDANNNRRPQT